MTDEILPEIWIAGMIHEHVYVTGTLKHAGKCGAPECTWVNLDIATRGRQRHSGHVATVIWAEMNEAITQAAKDTAGRIVREAPLHGPDLAAAWKTGDRFVVAHDRTRFGTVKQVEGHFVRLQRLAVVFDSGEEQFVREDAIKRVHQDPTTTENGTPQ